MSNRVYTFSRYINGVLMAEGVTIERQDTLENAMREAARIASRGPLGEVPVLVLEAEYTRTDCIPSDPRVKALLEAAREFRYRFSPLLPADGVTDATPHLNALTALDAALAAMEPRHE